MENLTTSYWQKLESPTKPSCEKNMVRCEFYEENAKINKNDVVKKNDEVMPEKIQIQAYIPHDGEVNRIRHNPH